MIDYFPTLRRGGQLQLTTTYLNLGDESGQISSFTVTNVVAIHNTHPTKKHPTYKESHRFFLIITLPNLALRIDLT